jgi:DNA end-binding protein Ku
MASHVGKKVATMASIWSGSVGFGLVQIPVSLHPAEDQHEFDMDLLDKRDLSPVGYKRVNKATDREVGWSDIVKGYEHSKGQYVILTPADFAAANVKATRQVDITAFVDFDEIDPRYIERPYYLVPQKAGTKAYVLLRETLRETGKAGIGKIVLRTRQHLAALVAHETALLLILLRFDDEVRDESKLSLPTETLSALGVTDKERSIARHLVEALAEPFTPKNYVNEYHSDLLRLIDKKVEAGEVNVVPEHPDKKPSTPRIKSIDLATLLTQSMAELSTLKHHTPANETADADTGAQSKKSTPQGARKPHKAKAAVKRTAHAARKTSTPRAKKSA